MKRISALSAIILITSAPVLSADIGFNPTAMAYVAIPLGAKTKTSFTTYGLRFGQVETSGYYDERTYSPLNDIPTLSRLISRPALWELKSDKWGISSFKINGLEAANREFTLNAAGAITAAASSINWGMVAAGTAATVAVAAAGTSSSSDSTPTSSGNSSTSGSTSGASTPSSSSGSSTGSSNTSQPAPAPAPAPAVSNDDHEGDDSRSEGNDDNESHSEDDR